MKKTTSGWNLKRVKIKVHIEGSHVRISAYSSFIVEYSRSETKLLSLIQPPIQVYTSRPRYFMNDEKSKKPKNRLKSFKNKSKSCRITNCRI